MPEQYARIERAEQKAAERTPGPDRILRDTWYVFWREMLLPLRDPFSLVFSLLQPLVFLGLFGPLLGSAVGAPAFGGQPPSSGSCPASSS
jgi:ABC-2 type transport system permease protein